MNGSEALLRTLVSGGVDVCFMNPGTSEMHFVAALDDAPEMRGVLALFEGVATGAADGYARIAQRPAATLLHLGPGLGNGLANLHNARRAHSQIVNIVGDHATGHKQYDAQLDSDIVTVARNVSSWIRAPRTAAELVHDAAAAIAAAMGPPGQVATLVAPADAGWQVDVVPVTPSIRPFVGRTDHGAIPAIAEVLRSDEPTALLIGGRVCHGEGLVMTSRIAGHAGARLLAETFPARLERGAGRPVVDRLAYLAEFAALQLDGLRHLVLVDAASPVSFFAYPGKQSDLVPPGCAVHHLASPDGDVVGALAALADELGIADHTAVLQAAQRPDLPVGELTAEAACRVVGALLPEGAIVSDEGNTSALFAPGHTAGAPPHDWLTLTGGAIGQGLPVAVGAAIAAPDRRVVSLQADGSALYTPQAWWTMAREDLDITTVVFDNSSYAVLNMELDRVGASAGGTRAQRMLDLGDPGIDLAAVASGLGVPATRATTCDEFHDQLARALSSPGPNVVVASVPPII